MLQNAMVSFDDTSSLGKESRAEAPFLRERLLITMKNFTPLRTKFLITKRDHEWCLPKHVDMLVDTVRREGIGVILLVRDPRDVLASFHLEAGQKIPYVSPEYWTRSAQAAEDVRCRLDGYSKMLTVHYEDLVHNPETVENNLAHTFGMKRTKNMAPMNRMKENLDLAKVIPDRSTTEAMHSIRNFDTASVGKWRENPSLLKYFQAVQNSPDMNEILQSFMKRYGYEVDGD